MKDYYDFFEKCLQTAGTNVTYCSKMANHIIPSKKFGMQNFYKTINFPITSNLNIKQSEGDFSNWKIVDRMTSFTNDDAKNYLNSLLIILHDAHYIENYDVTLNEESDSWVAVMKATDEDKKSEIYELFSDLPKSFNSRVLAYLS